MTAPAYRFGLNYVPSRLWYFCWNDWDASSIARDFDALAALGVDHLRVQLIWPWFQPNPTYVSPLHLARLREMMDLAAERKLDLLLCPLTGFLSGYRFLPPNATQQEIFTNPEYTAQAKTFFEAVLGVVRDHPAWMGFDLGNEISVLHMQLPRPEGDAWGVGLTDWLRPRMAGKPVVNGVDHFPWFGGRTFSLKHLATAYDAITLHCWPKFTGCLEIGPLDGPASLHLAAFMSRLAHWAQRDQAVQRPVWVQEYGSSSLWGTPAERATHLRRSIELAADAGATWFTWWCSHDVDTKFRFDPLEYDLGLLTVENQAKPLAAEFAAAIADFRRRPAPVLPSSASLAAPLGALADDFQSVVTEELPESRWLEQTSRTNVWPLFLRYLETVR